MRDLLDLLRDLPPPSFALLHHPMTALAALLLFLPVGIYAFLSARIALDASAKPGLGPWIGGAALLGFLPWASFLVVRPDLLWPLSCLAVLTSAIAAGRAARRIPSSLARLDPALVPDFSEHYRILIAKIEAVLATPALTPEQTLRHLEARETLDRLRARP
jgi:hypothetical protein